MKRTLLAILGAVTLFVGAAPGVDAIGNDVKGPACADIIRGDGITTGTSLEFRITLAAPSCTQVTYTTYVLDDREDTTLLASSSLNGNGSTDLVFSVPFVDDDDTVCIYITSSIGKHVFDRAPDAFCASLTVDAGSPGQDYS